MAGGKDGVLLLAFGRSVRQLRERLGLSQERLAELSGLHRTYVGGIERGERNVALINIDRLARALSTDLAGLMAEVERSRGRGTGNQAPLQGPPPVA